MVIKAKYINSVPYDFTDENGKRISGCTVHCYDPESKKILKCKSTSGKPVTVLEFGATINVTAVISGRYVKYEV